MNEKPRAVAAVEMWEHDPAVSFPTAFVSSSRIVHRCRPHIRLLYRELDVLSPPRREIVMASLSTVTDVFEQIVRKGIERGVFSELEPKLVALNALFLCHLWSLHTSAFRGIPQNIDESFAMQTKFVFQGLLSP